MRVFSQSVNDSPPQDLLDPNQIKQERIDAAKEEYRRIKLIDSIGWIKETAIKRSDKSLEDLKRERLQRKARELTELCNDTKFASLSEVDALAGISVDDKTDCKERLKTLNSSIQ
jgi:hypothetical protein